jgi:hypothetical protein
MVLTAKGPTHPLPLSSDQRRTGGALVVGVAGALGGLRPGRGVELKEEVEGMIVEGLTVVEKDGIRRI